MNYKPLTKKIIINNQECIACVAYQTSNCKIHTGEATGCCGCPVLSAMLNQLYEFESVYIEK